MKEYPREYQIVNGLQSLIQVIILIIAIVHRDWFLLAVVFVMSSNTRRVINYKGN